MLIKKATIICSMLMVNLCLAQVDQNSMTAHYIYVGQADATLLEFPCGAILIDAGAEDDAHQQKLIDHLEEFFKSRPDLGKTLDLVITTHPHIDHTYTLKALTENFHIKRFMDNGGDRGSGVKQEQWLRANAAQLDIEYKAFTSPQIFDNSLKSEIADFVDPISCDVVDPVIQILSGRYPEPPVGWSKTEFKNYNNHSYVIRVDFGEASYLFTGDLQNQGIETLLDHYKDNLSIIDADIFQVGHHGASNGTTAEFVSAISPEAAIISCGFWSDGMKDKSRFNTWNYGHPRESSIDLLAAGMTVNRPRPVTEKVGLGARKFTDETITRNLFATPWDYTIRVTGTKDGVFSISTHH